MVNKFLQTLIEEQKTRTKRTIGLMQKMKNTENRFESPLATWNTLLYEHPVSKRLHRNSPFTYVSTESVIYKIIPNVCSGVNSPSEHFRIEVFDHNSVSFRLTVKP